MYDSSEGKIYSSLACMQAALLVDHVILITAAQLIAEACDLVGQINLSLRFDDGLLWTLLKTSESFRVSIFKTRTISNRRRTQLSLSLCFPAGLVVLTAYATVKLIYI